LTVLIFSALIETNYKNKDYEEKKYICSIFNSEPGMVWARWKSLMERTPRSRYLIKGMPVSTVIWT